MSILTLLTRASVTALGLSYAASVYGSQLNLSAITGAEDDRLSQVSSWSNLQWNSEYMPPALKDIRTQQDLRVNYRELRQQYGALVVEITKTLQLNSGLSELFSTDESAELLTEAVPDSLEALRSNVTKLSEKYKALKAEYETTSGRTSKVNAEALEQAQASLKSSREEVSRWKIATFTTGVIAAGSILFHVFKLFKNR